MTAADDSRRPIELYAELLLNIKSATLYASIRSPHSRQTEILVETDGTKISVIHEGQTCSISLPARTIGKASATLTLPAERPKEIASRFEIEGDDLMNLLTIQEENGNCMPWQAKDMTVPVRITCRHCVAHLCTIGGPDSWRDLPSENWAEMMEFWHCHKPHDHSAATDGSAADAKGYSASSRIVARRGVGLIDLSSFLLFPEDCENIKIEMKDSTPSNLHCKTCDTILGVLDEPASGYRLFKWCISLASAAYPIDASRLSLPLESCITAQLLSAIDYSQARRLLIEEQSHARSTKSVLLIWVFTPDLWFSSSVDGHRAPTRATKILHKRISPSEAEDILKSPTVESLKLFDSLVGALNDIIRNNAKLLPSAARRYQDWDVSLMRRFNQDDLERYRLRSSDVGKQLPMR